MIIRFQSANYMRYLTLLTQQEMENLSQHQNLFT